MKTKELTNYYGEVEDIKIYLDKYKNGKNKEITQWLWDDMYHQGDIGTGSIAWIIQANDIFLNSDEIDWNYLSFTFAVMHSLEDLKFIKCPDWAKDKYRPAAIKALKHALSNVPNKLNEEQQISILSLCCAITGNYDSYELIEYGWKHEEQLMDNDIGTYP